MTGSIDATVPLSAAPPHAALRRNLLIAIISFLTLVDLFAAQALLPALTRHYGVTPAAMGFAVNASTIGMAVAGIVVALLSRRIARRRGIWISLAVLSIPTLLLATAPDVTVFMALRVVQGVFMSAAFTLTMAYLAENSCAEDAAGALAAYVTGNVASNLFGRLLSASIADHLGLAFTFEVFAALNLAGALLVYFGLKESMVAAASGPGRTGLQSWGVHLANPELRAGFAIGFLILFAFIGTFTYVNFVLVRPPIALGMVQLGLVYFVFVPSILTTPLAGRAVARLGARRVFVASFVVALLGLPLLLVQSLAPMLAGLVLVAAGTFFAQATATGFIGRTATTDRGAASGIYLASYYLGGLAGSAVLGPIFDRLGWPASVLVIGLALGAALLFAARLRRF